MKVGRRIIPFSPALRLRASRNHLLGHRYVDVGYIQIASIFYTLLYKSLNASNGTSLDKSMDVTLSLICLCHEKVGDVTTNVILITNGVSTKDLLKSVIPVSSDNKIVVDG